MLRGRLPKPRGRPLGLLDRKTLQESPALTVDSASYAVLYEGEPFQNDDAIVQLAARERQAIAPLAGQVLGKATGKVETNYTEESALADALTDILRTISSTDVALINTGGIRAPLCSL